MIKKWFKKNYKWFLPGIIIPLLAIIIQYFYSSNSNQTIQNVTVEEISGGVVGNNNTFNVLDSQFSEEHIKLIERRRQYININIDDWYKYEDGKKYLYHFNILVDDLIKAAEGGESILFQDILREIHFLSVRLEKNNIVKMNNQKDPGMFFYPQTNIELFLEMEETGSLSGKVMNLLTRGVLESEWLGPPSNSSIHLDSFYKVPFNKKMDVLNYDTIFNYNYSLHLLNN